MTRALSLTPPITAPLAEVPASDAPTYPMSALIKYTPWRLHTQITLQRTHAPTVPSLSKPAHSVHHPMTMSLANGVVHTHLYIERILSPKVAVVGCCNSASPARWVVKFYASDWASRWHLDKEIAAYDVLQGQDAPVFYGKWTIAGMNPDACSALLMEYVLPGTTIAAEGQRRGSVVRAVERVNRCGVEHRNLTAENVIVGDGGRVVLVGFGWAAVGGFIGADRWSLFQMGFLTAWDVPELV